MKKIMDKDLKSWIVHVVTPTLGLLGSAVFAAWSCVLSKGWEGMGGAG